MCLTSAVCGAKSCVTSSSTSFGTRFDSLEPTYGGPSLAYLLSGKLTPDEIVRWRIGSERGVVITVATVCTVGGLRVARIRTFLTAFFHSRLPAVLTRGRGGGLSASKLFSVGELTGACGARGDAGGESSAVVAVAALDIRCFFSDSDARSFGSVLHTTGEVVGRTLASKSSSSHDEVRQDLTRART